MDSIVQKLLMRFTPGRSQSAITGSPLLTYIERRSLLAPEHLRRLGTRYGGWTIPSESALGPESICYCAGAGEDISFDCALARQFRCEVRIIDPTPRAVEHFRKLSDSVKAGIPFPINNSADTFYDMTMEDLKRLSFLPIGLFDADKELRFYLPKDPTHVSCSAVNLQQTTDYFTAKCRRLASIMEEQGDKSVDLLKIDIEGSEYAVIKDMLSTQILPRLLLIEFDEINTPLDRHAEERIRQHITVLLQAGMKCVAIDGCNATFVRN